MANAQLSEMAFLLMMGLEQRLVGEQTSLISDFNITKDVLVLLNRLRSLLLLLDGDDNLTSQGVLTIAIISCCDDMMCRLDPSYEFNTSNNNNWYFWDEANNEVIHSKYWLDKPKLHLISLEDLAKITSVKSNLTTYADNYGMVHGKLTKEFTTGN